jgi:hypothetical protein
MDLAIPGDHLFNEPIRVKALSPELSITIPEEGGWVRKSVKSRTYKLTRYIVAALIHAASSTTVKLRASVQDQGTGHDIHYGEAGLPVSVVSVAKGVEQESFSIRKRDFAALVSLREELAAALNRLSRSGPRLRSAKIDDTPIEEHAEPAVLVTRLVAQIAPIVRTIVKRSQSPDELVVKRVLSDNRREEIFTSRAELLRKLAPLSAEARARFEPLGLGVAPVGEAEVASTKPAAAPKLPPDPTPDH